MIRRLLNLVTVASLLLCVAVVALWVRSYWYFEQVRYGKVPFAIRLNSQSGICAANWTTQWPGLSYGLIVEHKELSPISRERGAGYFLRDCNVRFGSFGYGRTITPVGNMPPAASTPTAFTIVTAPHWALAAPTALVSGLGLFRWYRWRSRPRAGHCRRCGYDLRASPDCCPECGTPR